MTRLSPIDAAWYHLDQRGRSLDIGALLFFDEHLDMDSLRGLAATHLAPRRRFHSRVAEGTLGLGPRWEKDSHFDIDAHLHHQAVPEPGDQALASLVGDLMSAPMDLDRPLWDLYLLDHRRDPGSPMGSALLARVHHCIGDGFALGHLLLSMGDSRGSAQDAAKKPEPGKKQDWLHHLKELATHPDRIRDDAQLANRTARAMGHLVALPFDSETILSRPLSHIRRAAWSGPITLDRVKRLGKRLNATVNDVLMAALSGALRSYLIDAGEPVSEVKLRAVMPVNLRPARFLEEMPDELGNHFGLVFVQLPIDKATAMDRLFEIKLEIDRLKQTPEAVVAFGILQALGRTPVSFEHKIEDIFIKKASLVASNLPGPRTPLYFAGRKLQDFLFWPPHPGNLGLGMSILSYNGQIRIGIRSDAEVIDNPATLAAYFCREFERIEEIQ